MREYRCGSIWLVSFDPSVGTEIKKTRPALIISPTDFNQVRSKVTLLPISKTIAKTEKLAAVVVRVLASVENGLDYDSTIVAIEPCTFDRKRLVEHIGDLEADYLVKVKDILQFYLDFNV
ncbi:MAG: type II toxin-antitoxin system PemK/MazF family toxin [Waterburya sp.]